jgi:hypothetical protein
MAAKAAIFLWLDLPVGPVNTNWIATVVTKKASI